jgi:soluble lytic murein transglycosylase-like protein
MERFDFRTQRPRETREPVISVVAAPLPSTHHPARTIVDSRITMQRLLALLLAAACALASYAVLGQRAPSDARSGPDPRLREILVAAIGEASSFDDRFHAEVWLTDMSRRLARQVPDANERIEILTTVHQQATRAGVSPELVLAVIDVESNFDRFAISSASALGLMQVMPFWVPELGYEDKNVLFKIQINVLLGCYILKYYLDMEDGDMIKGLARYNGSVGRRVYADRVIERLRTKWFRH